MKKWKWLALGALVLVVLGVGAKMTVLKSSEAATCPLGQPVESTVPTPTSAPADGGAGSESCVEPEPGAVLVLDPVTVNLADGRYLKVGLALQLSADADPKVMSENGGGAPALDAALELLGSRTYVDLIGAEQRSAVKATLSETVAQRYEGEVLGVYFTEFVMQ